MNKKGAVPLLVVILAIIGIFAFFIEDVPAFSEELKKETCIPIKTNARICFLNESGIRLEGNFKDMKISLNQKGIEKLCYISQKKYNFEQICETEFGYLYQKNDFVLEFIENGNVIKTIANYEIYGTLIKILENPSLTSKAIKTGANAFAIRGVIYLAEHPEVFNQTGEQNEN